ncbi:hypothetical protein [Gloeocapsopsis sp. IPPAS B-1203]|nr:hypothetical protein [Gloeocapsopsis sp. IPPAS B-1203]
MNTVGAGVVDTEMLNKIFGEQLAEVVKAIALRLPVKQIGKPEEIAD